MLCEDVKKVIYFFLDGELGEKRQNDFSSHLSLCPPCEQRARIQRRLRQLVRGRLSRLSAPDHLRNRLTRSMRAFREEWSR